MVDRYHQIGQCVHLNMVFSMQDTKIKCVYVNHPNTQNGTLFHISCCYQPLSLFKSDFENTSENSIVTCMSSRARMHTHSYTHIHTNTHTLRKKTELKHFIFFMYNLRLLMLLVFPWDFLSCFYYAVIDFKAIYGYMKFLVYYK